MTDTRLTADCREWPESYGATGSGEPYAVYRGSEGEPDDIHPAGLDPSAQPVDPHDAARDAAWLGVGADNSPAQQGARQAQQATDAEVTAARECLDATCEGAGPIDHAATRSYRPPMR